VRAGLAASAVAGVAGGAAWLAFRYVTTSPRFAVEQIVTTGGKRRSSDDLAALAGIERGKNVFAVDLAAARARLLADPWVSEAAVVRQLPRTMKIRVVEREAVGLVAAIDASSTFRSASETFLVTSEGEVIKRLDAGDPTDLPVVTGMPLQQLTGDREGSSAIIQRALDLAGQYTRSPMAARMPLEEVRVKPSGELVLLVGKHVTELQMGVPPYRRKLEQATRVMAELDRRGASAAALMLDNEARADRVVVRMR